jgi:hypothetical protein
MAGAEHSMARANLPSVDAPDETAAGATAMVVIV